MRRIGKEEEEYEEVKNGKELDKTRKISMKISMKIRKERGKNKQYGITGKIEGIKRRMRR